MLFKVMDVRCKHCRKHLFDNVPIQLLTAHHEFKKNSMDTGCDINDPETCSYISAENMPQWIEHIVNQESWTKGRIHCPHCNNRVGSFNFVNELKCNCGKFVTPPIRIIQSKVDILFNNIQDNPNVL